MMHISAPRMINVALDKRHSPRPTPRLHRFRVSRKTARKFINRYERLGDAGLHDLPRAPHSNPRATDPAIAAMIVKAKQDNSILGPKKIIPNLRDDHPNLPWPAPTRGKRHTRPRGTRNGPPFASAGLGGLSAFAVHLVKLGITPERIAPGHPERNGRLERFHRTLKEAVMSPPAPTLADQQRAFDVFRRVYNEERPHEALGQRPPASRYAPSPRPYPDKVASPEYAEGVEVRRVRSNGEIKWAGERVFVSEALIGEPVGLVRHDDRCWTVRFGHLEIGRLDGYAMRIIKTPVRALPMYPG